MREDRPEQSTTRSAEVHDALDHDAGHPAGACLDPVDDDAVRRVTLASAATRRRTHLLEQGPGQAEDRPPPVALGAVPAGLVHPRAGAVDPDRAQRLELVVDAGEPADQQVEAGGQQQVQVTPLRHVAPRHGGVVEPLPLEHDDVVDVVGQRPRGQQARDARPDDDRGRHPAILSVGARTGSPPRRSVRFSRGRARMRVSSRATVCSTDAESSLGARSLMA